MKKKILNTDNKIDIAIIGMSGRFPGARSINAFWDIIRDGEETITYYTKEELLEKGVDSGLLNNTAYVLAGGFMESADKFDSSFFGYTPREADFMDPQHRVFLEECYSALENAGYDPEKYDGEIGVFAGCSRNNYLLKNLSQHTEVLSSLGELQTIINNDKDFLTTRVSYKLNLKGPSVDIQTACSTSLVAIHFACQSLINNECDMALGGGVFVKTPHGEGYIFEEGNIDSPTGHCHPFDKEANGTIFGEGAGVVVLKRLDDAIKDRDSILAVIKATAINNDGSLKVGYMAPGVSGQEKVISKAIDIAGIDPGTISYIETHGTGTKMGDPIEIEALSRVFPSKSEKDHYCALGSVKANIGHLDTAAGVTGLIKTVLVLKNRQLPPLINFTSLNPELNLDTTPFYINRDLKNWDSGDFPRRASVSSFGIGGTNSHAILEEWIPEPSAPSSKRFHLLPISAKSDDALQTMYNNLISHLGKTNDNIADIAFTLQNGRKEFKKRGILIWDDDENNNPVFSNLPYFKGIQKHSNPKTVFMFTGQGSQYSGMAKGLYEHFDSVKTIMDFADSLLKEYHDLNLLEILFSNREENNEIINNTSFAQPALFVIQYAIANLLMEFGIMPHVLIGHSIGEITAACLSGVFTFEDALNMVASRGKLMQEQVPGAMLSLNLSKDQVAPLLNETVEISLNNAPNFCVLSGSHDAIDMIEKKFSDTFPNSRLTRLKTSHAFHSRLMEPAIEPFLKVLEKTKFGRVNIPFISNVTGTWITNEAATTPAYWASHIRSTVNFSDGVSELIKDENSIFVEVGPGNTLSMLLSQFSAKTILTTLSTLRHPRQTENDLEFFFRSLSGFWINGGIVSWDNIYADEERYRVPLASYPFERKRHWIDPKVPYDYHLFARSPQDQISEKSVYNNQNDNASQGSTQLYHNRPSLDNTFAAPESGIEKRITAIWEELLGIKGIGVNDNFFLLGGHSLLATQIINRINEEFNYKITIDKFFNFPTISGLIGNEEVDNGVSDPALEEAKRHQAFSLPLSPSQERLWVINQIDNNTPAYNVTFTYIFEGKLDKKVFRESIEILFDRHKVLKSYIRSEEGVPVAYISDTVGVSFQETDLQDLSTPEKENIIQEFIEKESTTKFDIETAPLCRISLLNLGNEETLFNLTIHHLIFDGWSWGIFSSELQVIYNSLLSDGEIKLEPLSLDYFDYALKESSAEKEEENPGIKEFWKNKLNGITGQLNFPHDNKRNKTSTGRGGRVALNIEKEKVEKIKAYSQKENVTLFMFLLSVYGFLLSRYSGDKDICIGSPTANRPGSKLEKLIGLFINSIVLRLQIDEELTFSGFLKKVKAISIEALANQDIPFEKLVDLVQPERIPNVDPIFQVMFAWQNTPRPPLDLMGIKTKRVFQKNGVSPLDMTFYAWEENGSITGEIEFCKDILNRTTIEYFKDNFISLLEKIIENPEIPLKDIPIISGNDKKRLLEFNNTDTDVPEAQLQTLFEQKVKTFADKIAIERVSNGNSLNYSDLEKRSNQLAHYLQRRDFKQGSIAGISMNRSELMVIAVLGILKAGGTYLPLDPTFPDDRLFFMLEDSGAKVLITEEIFADRFKTSGATIIKYDTEQTLIEKENSHHLKLILDVQSIAYMIYTSGSTGKPKGVKVHHKAVVNFINSMSKIPGITSTDKLLAVTTLSFDISILELFLPLSMGATVFIADNEHIIDGEALAGIIEEYNISIMQATPVTWTILLSSGWKGNRKLKALCGGEALLPSLARDLLPRVSSLWNMYGPTETTVWSSCELITDYERILIGKPIDNTQFYVLHNYQEQPVGAIGELCIGGTGVSKGYHNREQLTREKFLTWNDKVIYRTGDLARFLPNGKIELFGRTDNQIKFRGFRIEPGEIEFQLSQIKNVKEAVVRLERFGDLDERLIGFLNVTDSFSLNRELIIKSIENKLPNYMIPSSFLTMKEFPRTLNGKIDRKALVFSAEDLPAEEEREIETLTEIEKSLVRIWQNILKIKNIKKNQSFFDIGGNSLSAIRCINKIKEELGSALTFRELIVNPTIEQVSSLIENQTRTSLKSVKLVHLPGTTNLPLSINQKRIWLISKLLNDIPSYIIPFTYHLIGPLNKEIFNKSLNTLFQRHPIMFSVITESNGEPYCDLIPSEVNISAVDYSQIPENEKETKVNALINLDSRKVFDLKNGPLYRLYLIQTNPDEYYFHISIHHIIFDGWSWSVLVDDLDKIYNGLLKGEDPGLENIEFQQYDYAFWEQHSGKITNEQELIEFWKDNLKDTSPVFNFPYDFHRENRPSGKGSHETIQLSREISGKLRKISKKENSSLFSTMLSVFGIQMQKYSGEDDINIGLPVAYRPHSSLENIFGMFVNTVVVRLKFEKDFTFKKLIHSTQEASLNAIAHQDLPFETIVEIVNPERSSGANPLFQVGFAWQNNLNIPMKLDGIKSERITGKEGTSVFDLALYMWENGDIIEGEIEFNDDLLRRDTIIRLKENFISIVENVLGNPDQELSEISIISESDKKKLEEYNSTDEPIPDCPVQDLFENQVLMTPGKTAIISKSRSLTYLELDEMANKVARHLIHLGVAKGEAVGVFFERSAEMVISVLGILKSGCCYLPLDPAFPADRLSYMFKDSGAKVLISQSSLKGKLEYFENASLIILDDGESILKTYPSGKPDIKIDSQSSAYIIYTSGSTGKPKGVKVHHQAVVNLINTMSGKPGIDKNDVLLAVVTLSFDMSVFELFLPLSNGATVVIADSHDIADGKALMNLIEKHNITVLQATPSLWQVLLASGWKGKSNLKALCGGEALTSNIAGQILQKVGKLWNCYGPTETTIYSTCTQITDPGGLITIGKPLGNTKIYILDKNNNLMPPGVRGEIGIGGLGVSKGYNNKPELTAEKFVSKNIDKIIYKTGDVGRILNDGNIELFGRIDNQVKIRGFRIEPAEIELVLSQQKGIKESVVKIHKYDGNDARLVAYLNVSDEYTFNPKELNSRIKEKLPSYMVPSTYKIMKEFPKTSNGKVDRKALVLEEKGPDGSAPGVSKTLTPTARIIHTIWSEILKNDDITATDNFFDVGGNSLLAISVFSKMESAFNIELGLRIFFDSPRIIDLAEAVDIALNKLIGKKPGERRESDNSKIVEGEI